MKRGQVTLFIIIGIVLLITVGIFLAVKPKNLDPTTLSSNQDETRLEFLLASCLESTLADSIYYAAATTFFTPEDANAVVNGVPIFHIKGAKVLFPDANEISYRYGSYLKSELSTCMDTEDATLNQEFMLDEDPYSVEVIIAEDEIKATTEVKGKLVDGKRSRTLEKVSSSKKTTLAPMYHACNMVAASTVNNPFDPVSLDNYATEKNFYGVATYGPTDGTIEFTFVDFEEQLEVNFLVAP